MAEKQHTHKKQEHNPRTEIAYSFESFVEKELEKSIIELVNAKSWSRSYIALGRIRTIARLIDEAQRSSGKQYRQFISVTFKRVR